MSMFRAILVLCLAAASADGGALKGESLEAQIDALMSPYDSLAAPGYAIGVIENGEIAVARGYGAANIATRTPITAKTPFNLASLSKQFTGAALALEIKGGGLRFEDQLETVWPGVPDFARKVALAHLAYMTSGLPEYYSLPPPKGGWGSEDAFTVNDAICAVFAAGALEFEPGSRWAYSNTNYQILAEIVARKNAASFGDHVAEAIFMPLDMTSTWVDDRLQHRERSAAVAYTPDAAPGAWREAPRMSPHYGGSGVFSSLADLAKWEGEIFGEGPSRLGVSEIMLATRKFAHPKENDGLGLAHGSYKDGPTVWYEGGDYGVSTYMLHLRGRGTTIICLANFAEADCRGKARAVADILLK